MVESGRSVKMSWPKAILLDFYGTVVEEDDAARGIMRAAILAVAGDRFTEREFARVWEERYVCRCGESHGERFCLQSIFAEETLRETLAHFQVDLDAAELIQHELTAWKQPALFPEAAHVLAHCPLPICLVSNIDNVYLDAALAYNGLSFNNIVTSEDVRAYKPHPAPFLRALEMLSCRPEEVLHVGDSRSSDLAGAQALGMPVLWINRSGRSLPAGMTPTYMAGDLTRLLDILQADQPVVMGGH